jgi:hypothetical protein
MRSRDAWEKHWLALTEELKLKQVNEGLTDEEKEERRASLSKRAKHLYVEKLVAVSIAKPCAILWH